MLPTPREPCSRRLQPPVIGDQRQILVMVDMASAHANDSAADWELTIAVPMPECGYQLPEREVP